jgi:hypothetical protein
VDVQAYDADTAKLDVAQTWTAKQDFDTATASFFAVGSTTIPSGVQGYIYRNATQDCIFRIGNTDGYLDIIANGNNGYYSAQNNHYFYINGSPAVQINSSGNIVVNSGSGIDFSATADSAGTMSSELLDDYEEGTFTPTVVGASSAGTATYTEQSGYYTKVGNRVLVNLSLAWSSHTGTGAMRISGLPFTNENVTHNFPIPSFYVSDITLTANNLLQGVVNVNATQILLYQYPVGGGASATIAVDAAGTIRLSLQYQTAS